MLLLLMNSKAANSVELNYKFASFLGNARLDLPLSCFDVSLSPRSLILVLPFDELGAFGFDGRTCKFCSPAATAHHTRGQ